MSFINFNGSIINASQNMVHHTNRGFRYGDGIFESMVMFTNEIKLLALHAARLASGAQLLELNLPSPLNLENIGREIEKLCDANHLANARIRIILFRNSSGFYSPDGNEAGYIIESEEISNSSYQFNAEGLRLGIYTEISKPINLLSNIKTCNALLYVKAGLYKNKNQFDECILLNENQQICESISSNIFWIRNNKIFTSSKSSGCILGVMRTFLIQQFNANELEWEEGEYTLEQIITADEVFLTGATKGIQWVKEINCRGKIIEYSNTKSQTLLTLL